MILILQPCDKRKCVNVRIMDDQEEELHESFTYCLRRLIELDSRIELNPVDGELKVCDNDGKYKMIKDASQLNYFSFYR